jgi:hypothetical protein
MAAVRLFVDTESHWDYKKFDFNIQQEPERRGHGWKWLCIQQGVKEMGWAQKPEGQSIGASSFIHLEHN